ncbi:hypothetical protein Landi51_12401 [Colletotrichum acutatum]
MAAESVGLAASVAGLLSLGLQITGGIVKYMDAFEGREDELRNVKKQNDNLAVTLRAMKTVLAGLQGQSTAVAAALDQNIRGCEEDLRAVEALCIQLSDRAGSTWTNRLGNKKKKVTFAFHRPKLRDLELQLQKAHGALQLIQGSLGLENSNKNIALLAAIQSRSRDQASGMLLVRSGVAALGTPVGDINDKLPGLQSSVDQTRQLIVAHSGAIEIEVHESSQRVRYDLQHSHNSIVEHLKTIDQKVQLLGDENSSLRALALKAASKPAVLKRLSPLHYVTYRVSDWNGDAVKALSKANFESQPAISNRILSRITNFLIVIPRSMLHLEKFTEVATAFECGPLSTAIINNDLDEVDRVLRLLPDSVAELDIYGRSPLHIAAAKPEILGKLVKVADLSILNQRDSTGANALETAMVLSSEHCVNGSEYARCKGCSCYLCVKYLLDAGCNLVRTHEIRKVGNNPPSLSDVLEGSSELARRHYIFQMRKSRSLRRPGHAWTKESLFTKQKVGEKKPTTDIQRSISQDSRRPQIRNGADEAIGFRSDWIFQKTTSVHLAQLFYRHAFMPEPSVFLQLRHPNAFGLRNSLHPEMVCWLFRNGGDLFLRSSAGPFNKTANDGVFAAHYVFYLLGRNYRDWLKSYRVTVQVSAAFETLRTTVAYRNLTDGCRCLCSTGGCSPFTWMMKGFVKSEAKTAIPEQALVYRAETVADYYSSCGPELTLLTYAETIRFMTFETIGLAHRCCNAYSLVPEGAAWVEIDDTEITEDQDFLIDLYEELVVEFTQKASGYLGDGMDNLPLFPQFWKSYWVNRMTQELEALDGGELSESERRDAEEIGVVWDEPTESDKCQSGNPYGLHEMEHYWFELDLICPEYNEPWSKGMHRIH